MPLYDGYCNSLIVFIFVLPFPTFSSLLASSFLHLLSLLACLLSCAATLVQFSVISTSDQALTFRIDANSSLIKMPLSIMVSNILPLPNEVVITTHTYDVLTFSPVVCVKNLQSNTYYNICLCVDSEARGIGKQNICIQHQTNGGKETSASSCLMPTQTSTSMIENPASSSGMCVN